MNLTKYIIVIGLVLASWMTPVLSQDYVAVVCGGDTGMAYYVSGLEGSSYNWTVKGGVISRNYGDSIIVDWGITPGEYELTVQEVSQYGCSGDVKRARVLISAPEIELGSDTYICDGDSFTLEPVGDYFSYLWSDGSNSPTYTTAQQGLISLMVSDQYGCQAMDELYLEVKPLPQVDLGRDTSLCGEQMIYLQAGDDGINYKWSTGESSQQISVYQGYQVIWVQVEDAYGCENSDTLTVNECDPETYFSDINTAITPSNQDGRNDYWEIEKLQMYPDAVVDIYDRWGRLVWRSEPGYPTPWDGRDLRGKEVPMDSYHFVILLNFSGEDRFIGSITVIR